MSCSKFTRPSIVEIFNEMDYEDKRSNCKSKDCADCAEIDEEDSVEWPNELDKFLKTTEEVKSFDGATEAALQAQKTCGSLSPLSRANLLHMIWKNLTEFSLLLPKSKNEFSLLIDYFDFYSDLIIQSEECRNCIADGVILIILSNYSPFFVVPATVPAALAAGCSVIVAAPKKAQEFLLFLGEVIVKVSQCKGLFNVVSMLNETDTPALEKISKIFLCDSYLSAQKFYKNTSVSSFNFFCPNNTAALILESADLDAAVHKIIHETWGKDCSFAISTVVVQESIYRDFFEKLKFKMNQFMNENKNSSKFKDKTTAEKINKIISEALNSGASVEKATSFGEWSPTVTVNYQNQDADQDVPILKVLLCRMAREGVALVNNCRFTLGTSVWSEISSEALEISSMLISPNVWINCHGVFDAGVPIQLSGFSGNCVLGGSDGIWEYLSYKVEDIVYNVVQPEEMPEYKDLGLDDDKILQAAGLAQQAFTSWQYNRKRRSYIKGIANSLASDLVDTVSSCAHCGNLINFTDRNPGEEILCVRKKIPIGVILLLINATSVDEKAMVNLITPAIALGNAVIVVLKEENPQIQLLIKNFMNHLPKNVLCVIVGVNYGICLASDPNIQVIWLYDEFLVSMEFLKEIRRNSVRNLKIWLVPKKVPVSQQLYQSKCLQNKVIWMTKIDQFP